MNFNYIPLHEPVTQQDIHTYEASRGVQLNPLYQKLLFGVGCAIVLYSVSTMVVAQQIGPQLMPAIFLASFLVFIYRVNKAYIRKRVRMDKFARINNLTLVTDRTDPPLSGVIFGVGHSRQINEALILPDGTEIGNYQYTTGSGKNRQTHIWGYMRVKLVRHVPNMLLDSKKNNFFGGRFSNLPQSYTKDQTLKLEGDFNDHFTLYAPSDYGQDALYIFTPDVMAALIDHGSDFDMEVIDNNLVFYRTQALRLETEQELQGLLTVLEKISSELIDQADYYADSRVGDRALDVIAEPGKRLKSRMPAAALFVIICVVFFFVLNPAFTFVIQLLFMR